jgi:hypothetical protein
MLHQRTDGTWEAGVALNGASLPSYWTALPDEVFRYPAWLHWMARWAWGRRVLFRGWRRKTLVWMRRSWPAVTIETIQIV